jgi:hypothetical protein
VCTGCLDLDARLEIYVGSGWGCQNLAYRLFSLMKLLSLWPPWWKMMVNWGSNWKSHTGYIWFYSQRTKYLFCSKDCIEVITHCYLVQMYVHLISHYIIPAGPFDTAFWWVCYEKSLSSATRFLYQRFTKLTVVTCSREWLLS